MSSGAPASAEPVTLLSGDATVITDFEGGKVVMDGAVAWRGERLLAVGERRELEATYPEAVALDARGGVVIPGGINLHHHFYSALARGLDPGVATTNFPEVLDRLWWRLDRALDAEAVGLSARLALVDAVRWGCTTVFDHHASPSALEGSLDVIAEAVAEAGISALLCYEVTNRNGAPEASAGLTENLRFLEARKDDPRIRGVLGLHAAFTLEDKTLEAAAELRPEGSGCHIHLAEDPEDGRFTREAFGCSPVERLRRFGLLDSHALLAHGIHLDDGEYAEIAEAGSTLIHNPESNANNGVGRLDPLRATEQGCFVGLGTDGMSGNVLRSLRAAFLLHRHARRDPGTGFEALPALLGTNAAVAGRFFHEPQLGRLVPGAPADLAVIDGSPPTPVHPKNVFGHLVYGLSESPVRHTVARGRVLMRDFELETLDPREIAGRAREIAPGVWDRFHGLKWGTAYLGTLTG